MSGWIEYKDANKYGGVIPPAGQRWHGVVKTNSLVGRDLDMFGMLFGISNYTNLPPVVGVRGLPPDISREAKKAVRIGGRSPRPGLPGKKLKRFRGMMKR